MTKGSTNFRPGDIVEIDSGALSKVAAHSQIPEKCFKGLRLEVLQIEPGGQLTIQPRGRKKFTVHPKFVTQKANATVAA